MPSIARHCLSAALVLHQLALLQATKDRETSAKSYANPDFLGLKLIFAYGPVKKGTG
jgi:hypothetical protein